MPTRIHFINVGQGNMTLIELDNGQKFLYDCNLTQENQSEVLNHIAKQIGWGTKINIFCCSHRDADHMRGVKLLHKYFPIQRVWDSGVTGTTPSSTEYTEYMELRRQVGVIEVKQKNFATFGHTELLIMNGKNDALADNANAQSIVIKVVHRNKFGEKQASVLLTGDTDAKTWEHIHRVYQKSDLSCSLLLASHHGSLTYFQTSDNNPLYTAHLTAKSPEMTIISVGNNAHGHPHKTALEHYTKFSTGSKQGNKVFRTDQQGHMSAVLHDTGGWELTQQHLKKEGAFN